jgi:hypothetical protein
MAVTCDSNYLTLAALMQSPCVGALQRSFSACKSSCLYCTMAPKVPIHVVHGVWCDLEPFIKDLRQDGLHPVSYCKMWGQVMQSGSLTWQATQLSFWQVSAVRRQLRSALRESRLVIGVGLAERSWYRGRASARAGVMRPRAPRSIAAYVVDHTLLKTHTHSGVRGMCCTRTTRSFTAGALFR